MHQGLKLSVSSYLREPCAITETTGTSQWPMPARSPAAGDLLFSVDICVTLSARNLQLALLCHKHVENKPPSSSISDSRRDFPQFSDLFRST